MDLLIVATPHRHRRYRRAREVMEGVSVHSEVVLGRVDHRLPPHNGLEVPCMEVSLDTCQECAIPGDMIAGPREVEVGPLLVLASPNERIGRVP